MAFTNLEKGSDYKSFGLNLKMHYGFGKGSSSCSPCHLSGGVVLLSK